MDRLSGWNALKNGVKPIPADKGNFVLEIYGWICLKARQSLTVCQPVKYWTFRCEICSHQSSMSLQSPPRGRTYLTRGIRKQFFRLFDQEIDGFCLSILFGWIEGLLISLFVWINGILARRFQVQRWAPVLSLGARFQNREMFTQASPSSPSPSFVPM